MERSLQYTLLHMTLVGALKGIEFNATGWLRE
jgi:hypothetical protein